MALWCSWNQLHKYVLHNPVLGPKEKENTFSSSPSWCFDNGDVKEPSGYWVRTITFPLSRHADRGRHRYQFYKQFFTLSRLWLAPTTYWSRSRTLYHHSTRLSHRWYIVDCLLSEYHDKAVVLVEANRWYLGQMICPNFISGVSKAYKCLFQMTGLSAASIHVCFHIHLKISVWSMGVCVDLLNILLLSSVILACQIQWFLSLL